MSVARNRITTLGRSRSLIGDYLACCFLWGAVAPAAIAACEAFGVRPNRPFAELIAWPIVLHPVPLYWLSLIDSWWLHGSVKAAYDVRDGMAFFVLTASLTTLWLVLPTVVLFFPFWIRARLFRLRSLSHSRGSILNLSISADGDKFNKIVARIILGCSVAISAAIGVAATAHWIHGLIVEYSAGGLTVGESLDLESVLLVYAMTGLPNSIAPAALLMAWRLLRRLRFA